MSPPVPHPTSFIGGSRGGAEGLGMLPSPPAWGLLPRGAWGEPAALQVGFLWENHQNSTRGALPGRKASLMLLHRRQSLCSGTREAPRGSDPLPGRQQAGLFPRAGCGHPDLGAGHPGLGAHRPGLGAHRPVRRSSALPTASCSHSRCQPGPELRHRCPATLGSFCFAVGQLRSFAFPSCSAHGLAASHAPSRGAGQAPGPRARGRSCCSP